MWSFFEVCLCFEGGGKPQKMFTKLSAGNILGGGKRLGLASRLLGNIQTPQDVTERRINRK